MSLVPWFVIGVLIAINALYVAAEFASVAVPRSRIAALAEEGNPRARGLLGILEDGVRLDDYIAACQIGITLTSLIAGAYAQATITPDLVSLLERIGGLSRATAFSVTTIGVLLVLTGSQVVIGELLPKSLALQFPERMALATYLPTQWSVVLYRPFIAVLNGSAFLLLKPFGVRPGGHRHVHSPDEIEFLLAASRKGGMLEPEAHRRLRRGLQLSSRTVRQLMVPRGDLVAIDATTPAEEILEILLSSPYNTLPVYQGSLDRIVGAVSLKDVASAFAQSGRIPSLIEIVRPIPFVPESLSADRLVRFFQEQKSTKAIVVDEFGGVEGIVSVQDVLEELFGEIVEEEAEEEVAVERLEDGRLRLPGSMALDEVETWIGVRWEGTAATVAGHVLEAFGRLPEEGETLEIDGVEVTVEKMSPKAILSVLVRPKAAEEEEEESEWPSP
jgi:CBS domain containing-hemolysin-like protein